MLNHMVKNLSEFGYSFTKSKCRRIYELRISEIWKAYHKIKFSFKPLPIEKVDFCIGEKWNDF